MILSGADIRQYIRNASLSFYPLLRNDQWQQNGVDLILDEIEFQTYNFTLGTTLETIEMPNDLMAFVQLRSTWARKGFIIPPTVIDAGFKGQITLEIARFTSEPYPVGERFAHIIFAKLCSPSEPYNGKYQNQVGITKAILD